MLPLRTRPLMVLTAELAPPQSFGQTPAGNRKIVTVSGGNVEGERISGRLLPGGGDWGEGTPLAENTRAPVGAHGHPPGFARTAARELLSVCSNRTQLSVSSGSHSVSSS